MLFSIVIPVYNVEKYLDECLISIIEQIDLNSAEYELLLIDDGSKDSSGQICKKYALKYPELVKVYHRTNHGLLLTRRFGYQMAKGEYVINCDSDDKMEPKALQILYDVVKRENPDVILFNCNMYDGSKKQVMYKDIFSTEEVTMIAKDRVYQRYLQDYSIVGMHEKCYRRACIDLNRDYTEVSWISNGEDSLQTLEIFDHANTYCYINRPLYDYRMGSGMTHKFDPRYFESFRVVIDEIISRKKKWQLIDFEYWIAVKTLATAGRAITQSRYGGKKGIKTHIDYLKKIYNDPVVQKYIKELNTVKKHLQKDHWILLWLLKYRLNSSIVLLLNIKNMTDKNS